MTIKKYRKKPVEIEAMQWDGTAKTATEIIDWIATYGGTAVFWCEVEPCSDTAEGHGLQIRTLEGAIAASPGDFVIRGVQNEFYPCKPDIFAATYDEVQA